MENNPYAPPASHVEDVVIPTASDDFRDLTRISSILSTVLLVGFAVSLLHVASSLMQYNLLSHRPYTHAAALANDARQRLISVGYLIVYFTTGGFFLRWIYLAQRNLPELGARSLKAHPGWAVGSFFVPFVNLWAPFAAMSQLVKASRSPRQWELEDTPFFLIAWWILWLIGSLLTNAAWRMQGHSRTIPDLLTLTTVQIASGAVSVPLYLLVRHIVRRVSRDQAETRAVGMSPQGF
jgi:hypothetical protein